MASIGLSSPHLSLTISYATDPSISPTNAQRLYKDIVMRTYLCDDDLQVFRYVVSVVINTLDHMLIAK